MRYIILLLQLFSVSITFAPSYEIINAGSNVDYHCKDIILANISPDIDVICGQVYTTEIDWNLGQLCVKRCH